MQPDIQKKDTWSFNGGREDHIEEIESIIDQARVLGDRHPTHGREQARIGSELREDVVNILEIMDSKYP